MFMGYTQFYVEVCTTVFLPFFLTPLKILCHNTLVTPLVRSPCNPIVPYYPLPTTPGVEVFNYMYITSPSL